MTKRKRPISLSLLTALAVCSWAAVSALAHAESSDLTDITVPQASIIPLDHPDQPLDTRAPSTLFLTPEGEKIWNAAKQRALNKTLGRTGGVFDFNIVPEGFISATNFHN